MTCTEFLVDVARIGPVCFLAGIVAGYRLRDRLTWGTDDHRDH